MESNSAPVPPPAKPKPSLRETVTSKPFLIGFFGWYVINGLIWLVFGNPNQSESAIFVNLFVFPVNLLALILFLIIRRTRRMGFGILTALAVNFVISLVLGLFLNGACFIPFFYR